MEARYLGEGIARIESGLNEFRAEVRADLGKTPTHSDIGSLRLLMEKEIELLTQRLVQNKEKHDVEMSSIHEKYQDLKADLKDIEAQANTAEKDKKSLQRQLILGFLGTLGGLVATNWWQGMGPG